MGFCKECIDNGASVDRLKNIFEEQKKLNEKCIDKDIYEIVKDPENTKKWVLNMLLALDQEKAEAVDSLSWKWWKKMDNDIHNLKVELVDMFHFLVSAMQFSGMDYLDLYDLYMKKNNLNHKRQDDGYKQGTYKKIIDGIEDNNLL